MLILFAVAMAVIVATVIVHTVVIAAPVVLVPAAMSTAVPARMLTLVPPLHPFVANKVDRLTTSVVLETVPTPVLFVRWRPIQVHRLAVDDDTGRSDGHRLSPIKRRWRHVANVDASIEARLVDTD